MQKKYSSLIFIYLLCLTGLFGQAKFNSNIAVGNWNAAASWTRTSGTDADGIPDADDTVAILNAHQIRINVNAACYNLSQAGSGVINFNTDNVTLAVGGNHTMTGSDATAGGAASRSMTVAGNCIVLSTSTGSDIIGINYTVSGTTTMAGTLIISGVTGTKTLTGDVTINATGVLSFSVAETVSMLGNLIMDPGSSIGGTAQGTIPVSGTFTVNAGGTSSIGGSTLTVTSTSTINGTLALTSITGTKTLTGNVTFNTGSGLSFTAAETIGLTNSAGFNGTVTISGTAIGILNISGTMDVTTGAVVSMGSVGLTVNGLTTIDGTITYTDNLGGKTFSSVTISTSGNWDCSLIDESFSFVGTLTNNGAFTASASSASASNYSFSGTSSIVGTYIIPNLIVSSGTLTNNGILTITESLAGGGTFTQAAGQVLNYSSITNPIVPTLNASALGNTVNYNGSGAQTIRSTTYANLRITNSGTKTLGGAVTVGGDLSVENTASLDVSSTSNYTLTVLGNWSITSTDSDPFREQLGRVIFGGTSGTQAISNPLLTETFYALTMQSSSAINPAYSSNVHIVVSSAITYTSGILQMNGNDLTLNMSAANSVFTAGKILSNVATTDITVTDAAINRRVDFDGTQFGDASIGLTINVTGSSIYFDGSDFYGVQTFTKTGTNNDDCDGGCVFNGSVTLNTVTGGDRWRMGHVLPDTFYNASINHLGNNNLIFGRQTNGNAFYGTTTIFTNSAGGVYFTRNNGTAGATCVFKGAVVITVSLSGNVNFSEGGSASNYLYDCTFESTIQCNSLSTSTGDIRFGNAAFGTVTLTTTARFINGSVLGQTNIRLRNLTQTGTLTQNLLTTGANSLIDCSSATLPCVFAGPVNFTTKRLSTISALYSNNIIFTISDTILIRNNTFNGSSNSISFSGPSGSTNSNGGNIFAAGTSTTITNSGVASLVFGSFSPDDFNGDVTFIQTGTGALQPAQNTTTASTFAGNISTSGSTAIITFNLAKLDGNTTQVISGSSTFAPRFTSIEIASSAALPSVSITVNNVVFTTGTTRLTSGTIDLNGNTLIIGTAAASAGTLVHTSGFFYNGTLRRWMNSANMTIGNARGLFPLGTSQSDYRPLWVAYSNNLNTGGTVSVTHTANYPSGAINITPYTDASWGNTVKGIANSVWNITTANSFSINGTSASIRFGGEGFGTFTLSDLNASLASSTVGTYSAATNSVVPLEVTRTNLSNGLFPREWTIGTRDIGNSPLPVTLLEFTAHPVDKQVDLNWTTASELNNDYFLVQRSTDGIHFDVIGLIDGMGTTSFTHHYSYSDTEPLLGQIYYRLRQTDFNGQYTYSNVVSVLMTKGDDLDAMVYPNPGDGVNTVVVVNSKKEQELMINVYNASGDIVYMERQLIQGQSRFQIPTQLAAGMYTVTITAGSERIVRRIVIR